MMLIDDVSEHNFNFDDRSKHLFNDGVMPEYFSMQCWGIYYKAASVVVTYHIIHSMMNDNDAPVFLVSGINI